MTSPTKWLLAICSLVVLTVVIGIAVIVISANHYHRYGPPAQERKARDTAIKPLLQSHATRDEVIQSLGLSFIDCSIGGTNVANFDRVPDPEVHQNARLYPQILFHTTKDTVTWLFFDTDRHLQAYFLGHQ